MKSIEIEIDMDRRKILSARQMEVLEDIYKRHA